ncbi:MAG TPA: fibronectin type III domain-containing protein [Gemmatimonadaceae bacterium]|nr:fibronectin type III domain-containing protein [Gemmatimonadaceae bacterium]
MPCARHTLRTIAACGALVFSACVSEPTPAVHVTQGSTPGAAFGIAAEPGVSAGTIRVSWSPVQNAETYAVYFSTTPGVTPSTGERIGGVPTSFLHTELTPGATYYYIVVAVNGDFEGPPSNEVSATSGAGIGLHIETPSAGVLVTDSYPFVVDVTSAQALTSLTAAVENISAPLTFDPSIGRWTGSLSFLSLVSPTARQVVVTGVDAGGHTARAGMIVRLDHPPVVTVTSPSDQSVVGASVHLSATCADDAVSGCASLLAYIDGLRTSPLATGSAGIDTTVSLGSFGGTVHLVFEGIDSAGQSVLVRRDVLRP